MVAHCLDEKKKEKKGNKKKWKERWKRDEAEWKEREKGGIEKEREAKNFKKTLGVF